ncbi:hypothetical protein [Lactobacillus helveticus]|uniref:hypothetical protein n=1 Tax=Lactobacillus helveticus TaxID=1587 RepID=UPI001562C2C1|nr:hypothetical protein [Lactobacillus helveticus]NRO55575.1 hypothetical protein [Lactobacillus helveticus]
MSFLSHHNQQNSGGHNQQINIDNSVHNFNMNGSGGSTEDTDESIGWFIALILVIGIITTFLYKVINPFIIKYNLGIVAIIFAFAMVNVYYAFKIFDTSSKRAGIIVQASLPMVVQMIFVQLNPHNKVTKFLQSIKLSNMSKIHKSVDQICNVAIHGNGDVLIYIFIQSVLFLLLYSTVLINSYSLLCKNKSTEISFQVAIYLVMIGFEVWSQCIIK